MQPRRSRSRREEPGRAIHQGDIGADLVQPLPRNIALCQKQVITPIPPRFGSDALPERSQLTRASGALPAISAPSMAPIEIPAIQLG
jgi:hypothetical protein